MQQLNNNSNSLPKSKILRQRNVISKLFDNGTHKQQYPLRYTVEISTNNNKAEPLQALFLVTKKLHKHAVTRNMLRRRIKEAFRTNQQKLTNTLSQKNLCAIIAFSYSSKQQLPLNNIADAMDKILKDIADMASNSTR